MLRIDCYDLSRFAKERSPILSVAKPRFSLKGDETWLLIK